MNIIFWVVGVLLLLYGLVEYSRQQLAIAGSILIAAAFLGAIMTNTKKP